MIAELCAQAVDGPIIAARVSGTRGTPIVFVHGVGSTADIWDYQLNAFADAYRCFAIDLRGNGSGVEKEPEPNQITREGFANDVLAVVNATHVDRFHFVGCSLGGVVGFELWRRAPQRFLSMTIVGSFAKYPDGQAYADAVVEQARAAGSMERFALERMAKLGMPPGRRADETYEQMAVKKLPSYIASTQATWTGDYRNVLATIDVPALVIVGERDMVAPRALSEEIVRGIPGAKLEVVPNAGHVTNADAPDTFNALLRSFITKVDAKVR